MFQTELVPVVKGMATFIPGLYKLFAKPSGGGTNSAQYCYSVWAKHLTMLNANGMTEIPRTVAELGPGDSLGVGICALLSGAAAYYAFDVVEYASADKNLRLLDELVQLYTRRAGVQTIGWPDFSEHLDSKRFPKVLTADLLSANLKESRVQAIRDALQNRESDIVIKYVVPWDSPQVIKQASVDLILSHSVLEHVKDLGFTLKACASWLKHDGWMSHQVDFSSHGISKAWNGHWQYSEWMWRLVVGGRPYLINRVPADQLLSIVEQDGYQINLVLRSERTDGLPRERLRPTWRKMAVNCGGVFFQARPIRR
jgi:hypothetical protein